LPRGSSKMSNSTTVANNSAGMAAPHNSGKAHSPPRLSSNRRGEPWAYDVDITAAGRPKDNQRQ
jgi:hypothetical protein